MGIWDFPRKVILISEFSGIVGKGIPINSDSQYIFGQTLFSCYLFEDSCVVWYFRCEGVVNYSEKINFDRLWCHFQQLLLIIFLMFSKRTSGQVPFENKPPKINYETTEMSVLNQEIRDILSDLEVIPNNAETLSLVSNF